MAEIIPFKGVLYNPERVDVASTVAPPYDIVSPKLKEDLYRKNPHNVIRIDFGKDWDDDNEEDNRYTRAARHLSDWLTEGILTHDSEPFFYCYEITYTLNGQKKITRGFLAAVRIEDLGSGKIHPHEMTYSKPKSDRLNILRHCSANTSPIFSLYSSEDRQASSILEDIAKSKPFIEFTGDDAFVHRLWRITDSDSLEVIKNEMSDKDVFIADGHHRYETALTFKKEMEAKGSGQNGNGPHDYVLMFLSNMEEEGLTLLPTHRMVEIDSDIHPKERLKKYFDVKRVSSEDISPEQARDEMIRIMHGKQHTFGMYLTNTDSYYTLSFHESNIEVDLPECLRKLDVSVLHKFIFEQLLQVEHYEYEMDPALAVERAVKSSFEAVFFLNDTKIHDLKDVALAGERMPPKSTYFYPKLLTGMVIYKY